MTGDIGRPGLTLSPDAGPDNPSGAPGGLLPGPVWRYQLGGVGGRVSLPTRLDPGGRSQLLIFPAAGGEPDAQPQACLIGVAPAGSTDWLVDQHGHPMAAGLPGCLVADQWNSLDFETAPGAGPVAVDLVAPRGVTGQGWLQLRALPARTPDPDDVLAMVDTRRGSHSGPRFSRGNTLPACCLPNGFVGLTPLTDARTRRWGYQWQATPGRPQLQGLAFTHRPSPWLGDRDAFQLMPFLGRPTARPTARAMTFDHDAETAGVDHYQVMLEHPHGRVRASMSPTGHGGLFSFDFDSADPSRGVILDQPFAGALRVNPLPDGRVEFEAFIEGPQGPDGDCPSAWVHGRTVQPVDVLAVRDLANPLIGLRIGRLELKDTPLGRIGLPLRRPQAVALRLLSGDRLDVLAATSLLGPRQARHNLELELGGPQAPDEGPPLAGWVHQQAAREWRELLGRLQLSGGTPGQRQAAISDLAQVLCWPSAQHENSGTAEQPRWVYASPYQRVRPDTPDAAGTLAVPGRLFVNNGYWDTYRTAWPLLHLLVPERAEGLIEGILQQYRESGWMSRWAAPGHVDLMVGTSSDLILADAAAHGLAMDEELAFQASLRNATLPSPDPRTGRKGIGTGRFRGWIDAGVPEGFSWSVENALCDAGLARWAQRLAQRAAQAGQAGRARQLRAWAGYLQYRAGGVFALFDPATGFFRGRRADGRWSRADQDFDPLDWGGDYVETTGWGMAFSTIHDGARLARLHGGPEGLARRLEQSLSTPETASPAHRGGYWSVIHEMVEARAVRLGQFGLSNQPAHHLPFVFLHAGRPWRTQELTRQAADRLLVGAEIGQGYPGDEDNGELSAWQLFTMLGLYPLEVGSGELVLTSPVFDRAAWTRADGSRLEILCTGQPGPFITSVRINGQPWHQVGVPVDVLHADCRIEVELGAHPTRWGARSTPAGPQPAPTEGLLDLTGRARLEVQGPGREELAGQLDRLVDDRGEQAVQFLAGQALTVSFERPVAARWFTLTCAEPTGPGVGGGWRLEALTADGWREVPVERQPQLADQTWCCPLPGLDDPAAECRALRWCFTDDVRWTQLEVV